MHTSRRPATTRTPTAAGRDIRYGLFTTALGPMLVAGTAHGVCHVAFGDHRDQLVIELHHAFASATVQQDDETVAAWASSISAQLEGAVPIIDLPVDMSGTPFQQRVWTALRRIPFGEVRSYQELAIAIGQPTAARAVASACASNRVAVVIPCHRVVRGTGAPGGYRWGIERKRWLINSERGIA
jgi:AraC family transcriptional regulator of adaptative response/methylated-DNA-[protein]-cysteine methyltransferase